MKRISAKVVSVYVGSDGEFSKEERESIRVEMDGIVGDRHRSYSRNAWASRDKQAEGTVRRNERQWSAVSVEELAEIELEMDLDSPLSAADLGANLSLQGVPELSRLPKGTILTFPSGAELIVEEFNPPCHGMGKKLASIYSAKSGEPIPSTAFSKAAKLSRGLVGVVEVPGDINAGDEVVIAIYETPAWFIHADAQ